MTEKWPGYDWLKTLYDWGAIQPNLEWYVPKFLTEDEYKSICGHDFPVTTMTTTTVKPETTTTTKKPMTTSATPETAKAPETPTSTTARVETTTTTAKAPESTTTTTTTDKK